MVLSRFFYLHAEPRRLRVFFGYFLLAKQKKVTRPQAKSEALSPPENLQIEKAA